MNRTAQLEAANKELDSFSYSISHDLRAPLRAIDGFSRIVLEDYSDNLASEGKNYLQMVRDNTRQMGQLVDDLLAFARLGRQSLTKQTVDVDKIVRRCLEGMVAEQQGRQVEIVIGELPACQADPALLKQVWTNLLANALKYTRKRDVARIEIGSRIEPHVVTEGQPASGAITGTEVVYFVKDNGAGFEMKYVGKLFGVFQRLHRAADYEGTGVGLAIVQRIVQRHGGRIWADAALNEAQPFLSPSNKDLSMLDRDVEILLVEDNPNDEMLALHAFRKQKIANHVHVVRDGAEALDFIFCTGAYADRNVENPKVILLDLKLPLVDGIAVLRAIRSDPRTRLVPVVVLTSSAEDRDIVEAYRWESTVTSSSRSTSSNSTKSPGTWDTIGCCSTVSRIPSMDHRPKRSL